MWKNYRNRQKSCEPHEKPHIGEKHIVLQSSPDVVSLHGGRSYADSSDSLNGIICHTRYIFLVHSKIRNKYTSHEPHARILDRSALTFKLVLMWFFSTVASHMLIQATIFMELFVILGTFLQHFLKSGVFGPSLGSMCLLNIGLYWNYFFTQSALCKYFSCDKC